MLESEYEKLQKLCSIYASSIYSSAASRIIFGIPPLSFYGSSLSNSLHAFDYPSDKTRRADIRDKEEQSYFHVSYLREPVSSQRTVYSVRPSCAYLFTELLAFLQAQNIQAAALVGDAL